MAAYVIADVAIRDMDRYPEYQKGVRETVARYGGRFLARGGETQAMEGDWEPRRLVIIEFEDLQRLREWYASPEYAPLKRLRQEIADTRLVAVEGT